MTHVSERRQHYRRVLMFLEIDLMLCQSLDTRKEPETPERLARCAQRKAEMLAAAQADAATRTLEP